MAFYKGAAKEAQRAAQLAKQREKDRQDIEIQKRKLEMEMRIGDIDNKFARHYDAVEQKLKSDTVGLVTLHEMRAKQEAVVTAREKQIAAEKEALARLEEQLAQEKKNAAKLQRNVLSFSMDAEEDEFDDDIPPLSRSIDTKVDLTLEIKTEEETVNHTTKNLAAPQSPLSAADDNSSEHGSSCNEQSNDHPPKKRKRLGMNPSVDTSFLPDIDREEEELRLREELRRKWMDQQNSLKEEDILITYSFWDGSGHRRQVRMKKGHSIAQFLQRCLDQCRKEFPELRSANHDQLMYVKEDLIIPQHYTFYDFIVTKARGKSGPLFVFDAHEDVRVRSDATVAKDESHAGKVCLRSWYERNKHIFPASRWEPYDPMKNWDEYSISDKLAAKIVVK